MRETDFSSWLKTKVTTAVIGNSISRCQRVENNLQIDLDDEFFKDGGKSLLEKLTYNAEDQAHGRPLKCNISFDAGANLRNGMGSLKSAVNNYFKFCREQAGTVDNIPNRQKIKKDIIETVTAKDSYQEFLTYFQINKSRFYEWGINATIFPPIDKVAFEWDNLKKRIFNNEIVHIRGYGRDAHATDLYKNFYINLVGNTKIEKDPTNNLFPQEIIQRLTELTRNANIYNYQVSHIWGHTKNVFMFEAPWNICYVPKIMDPFTGHETKGIWPDEYKKIFIERAYQLYGVFIEEYNQIMKKLDVANKLQIYISSLKNTYSQKELFQFEKDAMKEFSFIMKE